MDLVSVPRTSNQQWGSGGSQSHFWSQASCSHWMLNKVPGCSPQDNLHPVVGIGLTELPNVYKWGTPCTSFTTHAVLVWKKSSAWSIVMVGYGSGHFDKKRNCPTTEEKSPFSLRTIPCSVDFFLASLFLGRKVLWIFNSSAMLRTQDRINNILLS